MGRLKKNGGRFAFISGLTIEVLCCRSGTEKDSSGHGERGVTGPGARPGTVTFFQSLLRQAAGPGQRRSPGTAGLVSWSSPPRLYHGIMTMYALLVFSCHVESRCAPIIRVSRVEASAHVPKFRNELPFKIPCGPQGRKTTTAARAQVNPEGRARVIAGAHSGAAVVQAPERQRAEDEKPYFHDSGRIVGQVSRLYGYSVINAAFSSLFLCGFSSLPLTKWDDEDGLPKANVSLVSVFVTLWQFGAVSRERFQV